jgi:hypothetical protein
VSEQQAASSSRYRQAELPGLEQYVRCGPGLVAGPTEAGPIGPMVRKVNMYLMLGLGVLWCLVLLGNGLVTLVACLRARTVSQDYARLQGLLIQRIEAATLESARGLGQ